MFRLAPEVANTVHGAIIFTSGSIQLNTHPKPEPQRKVGEKSFTQPHKILVWYFLTLEQTELSQQISALQVDYQTQPLFPQPIKQTNKQKTTTKTAVRMSKSEEGEIAIGALKM